jgi:hypothetical protein
MPSTSNLGAPEIVLAYFVLISLLIYLDIYRNSSKDTLEKLVWTFVALLLPVVGVIVYLSVGRKDKFLYRVMKTFYNPKP